MRSRLAFAVVVAVALAAAGTASQQLAQFRASTDTVEIHATVRDAAGALVSGLTADDFDVFDNGQLIQPSVFSNDVQPITISLLLDRSMSIDQQARKVTDAAEAFVGRLLPDDRAAVNTLMFECQSLTSDKTQLVSLLHGRMASDSGSPVWSALDRTMTSISRELGRRAILMFSDGDDPGIRYVAPEGAWGGGCRPWTVPSRATFADVRTRAQRDGITVYSISVDNVYGVSKDTDLRAIARESGGDRYRLRDDAELAGAFTRIADELHHQYLIGFVPAVFDGKVHTLEVRVKRPNTEVHARQNYVAARVDVATSVAPPAPLSPREIQEAISRGNAGEKLQASCRAAGVFLDKYLETDAVAEVVLEGPVGRMMRLGREATSRRMAVKVATLPAEWIAPTLQATTVLKHSALGPNTRIGSRTTPEPPLAGIVSVVLRSASSGRSLTPIASEATRATNGLLPAQPHVDVFDLAAFRSLQAGGIEVIVRSKIGGRACTINARDRAVVR